MNIIFRAYVVNLFFPTEFDVFLIDTDVFWAFPITKWELLTQFRPSEFYFSRVGQYWKTEPEVAPEILFQIIEQLIKYVREREGTLSGVEMYGYLLPKDENLLNQWNTD